MSSILVIDDHPLFRRGLRELLCECLPNACLAEAADAAEALARIPGEPWDLITLDLVLPDRAGLQLLRDIKAQRAGVRVLVVTTYSEALYGAEAVRAGAEGYITKHSPPDEVVRAAARVLSGKRYISDALGEKLASDLATRSNARRHSSLSKREFQIMCKLAAGKSVTEIARELSLSVKTVSTFRARLLRKMHMASNAELARYATLNAIID